MHNKSEMAICFGFKWNVSLSQGITRVITFRIDLLCLHLDNSELRSALSATREHANTHINFKTPLIMIEKVVLWNQWRRIRSLSLRQFVSTFTSKPLCLTWATMCTYRVETFNFFKTGTISVILSAFENWSFKWSLTKMIERWMIWQDFSLKRKLYYHWGKLLYRRTGLLFEPGHEKMCLMSYANNKGADQTARMRSLISAFVVRLLDCIISLDSMAEISRL